MTQEGRSCKLNAGLHELEQWAETARQAQKNVLYKALFSVTDGSVFRQYSILRDAQNPWEHFVLVRENLVLKISFQDPGSFGILYIGPLDGAPRLDLALDLA